MRGEETRADERPPAYLHCADQRWPGRGQAVFILGLACLLICGVVLDPGLTGLFLVFLVQMLFLLAAAWRILLILASRTEMAAPRAARTLPSYTILVALLDEAEVLPQLVSRLSDIDYPTEALEGFLLLEAKDHRTLAAARALRLPDWLQVLIVPPGGPATKPNALNHGLSHATGAFITVYDAEDDPDPRQLREAAARFQADREAMIGVFQAPLRVRVSPDTASPFLDRQFAVEYAALFEATLPGLARLDLPFPLGGTSNHFRTDVLRDLGGWDAHNVTEDADLGFRLWRSGYRLGVLRRPTHEPPPGDLVHWLPQRTRWLKGYMQTWGVHTRTLRGFGARGMTALAMTLGMSLAAAGAHAVSIAWVVTTVAIALAGGLHPHTPVFALSVLATGMVAAWISGLIGARRAGVAYGLADMISAPAYWSLMSLAFVHAVWRLITQPFAWDKTPHLPDPAFAAVAPAPVDAGREAA